MSVIIIDLLTKEVSLKNWRFAHKNFQRFSIEIIKSEIIFEKKKLCC